MSTASGPSEAPMLHPELRAQDDPHAILRDGRRLDHAEGSSKPLRPQPEKQPRGARIRGKRPVDQAEDPPMSGIGSDLAVIAGPSGGRPWPPWRSCPCRS